MKMKLKAAVVVAALILTGAAWSQHPALGMEADDAPESVEIEQLTDLYGPVSFDHALHLEVAECTNCHHHTTGQPATESSCARCHNNTDGADAVSCSECHAEKRFSAEIIKQTSASDHYHIDKPGLKGAYHLNCVGCHLESGGSTGCEDCHQMTDKGSKVFRVSLAGNKTDSSSHADH